MWMSAESGCWAALRLYAALMSADALGVGGVPVFEVEHRVGGEVSRGLLRACWNTRFERAVPIRSFVTKRGTPGFSGLRWCATTGGHVGYESWLERDHLM